MRFSWILMSVLLALFPCFVTPVYALDINLAWEVNPGVEGYKIYYRRGSSGPPYNGTGAAEGNSPIDVGWVSEFTLRALSDDEDYYVAITAYKDDLESGYSDEVTTARTAAISTVGGAGGGGGGCFISALGVDVNNDRGLTTEDRLYFY